MLTPTLYIKSIIFILFVAFISQAFSKGFIVANYYSNTKQYALRCINKAKPKMHCDGKCQMLKKLKQEENKDNQNSDRKNEVKTDLLFFIKIKIQVDQHFIFNTSKFAVVQCKIIKDFSSDFFHPPSAI